MAATLYLCGTGLDAGQLTLESLAALRRCRKVLAVSVPREVQEGLRRLIPRLADGGEADARRLNAALNGGGDVGFVFLGHPLLFTDAPALIALCRKKGVAVRVLAAVSSADAALAKAAPSWGAAALEGCGRGVAMLGAQDVARGIVRPEIRAVSAIVNAFKLNAAAWKRLCAVLRRAYGPGHSALLFEHGGLELSTTVAGLAALREAVTSKTTLLLPMRR